MSKGALTLTSLVAAIPGGFLTYLTIMAFINYTDKMVTMLQVVTGVTLVISLLMALAPFAILLFVRTPVSAAAAQPARAPVSAAAVPAAATASAAGAVADEFEAEEELESADAFSDDDGLDDFGSADEVSDDSTGEFSLDDDEFEFDEDDK